MSRVLVRTDDEVYRVDAVWLGPPRATFPWRARYVSYGLGLLTMMLVMFVQRRVGIGLDFFSVAWALIITVLVTRFLGKRINFDRPLGQVLAHFRHEVAGPRRRTIGAGGPVRSGHVRIGPVVRPRPARCAAANVAPVRPGKGAAPVKTEGPAGPSARRGKARRGRRSSGQA